MQLPQCLAVQKHGNSSSVNVQYIAGNTSCWLHLSLFGTNLELCALLLLSPSLTWCPAAEAAQEAHNGRTRLNGSRPLVVTFANPKRIRLGEPPEPAIAPRKLFVGQVRKSDVPRITADLLHLIRAAHTVLMKHGAPPALCA